MNIAVELPRITIMPKTEHELFVFQEMLSIMNANFVVYKSEETLLSRFEEGLKEAKLMKEGKLPKIPLSESVKKNNI
jgi:hypothetical protein